MHHEVRAELERPLQRRRAEHVVDREERARLLCHLGERGDIRHFGERVRRRLEEKEPRTRPQCRTPFVDARRRDEGRLDAEAPEDIAEELDGGAKDGVRAHHVIAALQVHQRRGEDRRHARGGGDAALGALERGEAVLEHGDRRVGVARVHHALLAAGKTRRRLRRVVEHEARGEIERLGVLVELAAHLPGTHAQCRLL